jgi:uncharacterized protein
MCLNVLGYDTVERSKAYLNWDNPETARAILKLQFPAKQPILLFDEIHKYGRWRNLIKGIYDTHKSDFKIIVTGSARLDYYRKGGDSLANRYRYFRLHPFSITELNKSASASDLELLLQFGGFPEPFMSQDSSSPWGKTLPCRKSRSHSLYEVLHFDWNSLAVLGFQYWD